MMLSHHALLMMMQVVIYRDGQYLTLKEVFDSLDLTGCVFLSPIHIFSCCYAYQSFILMGLLIAGMILV